MNNIEKIRAEIERLLNKKWKWQSSIEGKFRCETYRELLQFIDSMPEEPSKDLAEAWEQAFDKEKDDILVVYDHYAGFVAGAEWMKKKMIDKACEWLENNEELGHRSMALYSVRCEFIKEFKKAMEDEK